MCIILGRTSIRFFLHPLVKMIIFVIFKDKNRNEPFNYHKKTDIQVFLKDGYLQISFHMKAFLLPANNPPLPRAGHLKHFKV